MQQTSRKAMIIKRPRKLDANSEPVVIELDRARLEPAVNCKRRLVKSRRFRGVCACLLFLLGCAVGRNHTSDVALEKNFIRQESEFEELRAQIQADKNLEMICLREVRYANRTLKVPQDLSELERLGLSRSRWERYQGLLRRLGIVQAFGGRDVVVLKVDEGSIANGDSYKGYVYRLTAPEHLRPELDSYRISEIDRDNHGDYTVSKHLKGKWYVYLFVNR